MGLNFEETAPSRVCGQKFDDNFNRIFKKNKKEEKKLPEDPKMGLKKLIDRKLTGCEIIFMKRIERQEKEIEILREEVGRNRIEISELKTVRDRLTIENQKGVADYNGKM